MANVFIARKMAFVEKQLYELSGSLSNNIEKSSSDNDEVWNIIRKMQDGDDDTNISPGDDPSKWQDALSTSRMMKDRLERQIQHLSEMIQKAAIDVDQAAQSVNQQKSTESV
jgi:hypothetical protein